jgi:hypothetical protein
MTAMQAFAEGDGTGEDDPQTTALRASSLRMVSAFRVIADLAIASTMAS